jgi:hypothetical protein
VSEGGQLAGQPGSRRVAAGESLADVLDRVLDKGIVIAGDIAIALVGIELLTVKVRLLIASADKAQEMGIDWWRTDPFLSGRKIGDGRSDQELAERVARLEQRVAGPNSMRESAQRSPRRTPH